MITTGIKTSRFSFDFLAPKKRVSLSTYFPNGTQYFYAYPAGQASGFLNKVTPDVEELVAARAASCAGHAVSIIKFMATHHSKIGQDVIDELGIPQLPDRRVSLMPEEIDANLHGEARNKAIRSALLEKVKPGQLVMAQPYTDKELNHLFQIDPKLTTWVNDKNNMEHYISGFLLPKRHGLYENGQEFLKNYKKLPLPCVVKASSSSSGDGVYICYNKKELSHAANQLAQVEGTILVEEYIEAKKNFGIHFGIPQDKRKPIDIIGVNEQLTTKDGGFIGGIISDTTLPKELLPIEKYLIQEVLPAVRAKGWYGIGCFDVLCDEQNRLYIIDGNFRITGMSAFHLLISNGTIKAPLMSFSGQFHGSKEEFEKNIYKYAGTNKKNKFLQIIALTRYDDLWSFNGAITFSNLTELKDKSQILLDLGVKSQALQQIVHS